jgi:DNA-binding NarL/FixJ family response regulator
MLSLILPHIEQTWKMWKKTNGLRRDLDDLKASTYRSEEDEQSASNLRNHFDLLSHRQRTVVEQLADGMDNQQIADELKISIFTVKKHLQTIFQTLEITHRTQLAAKWHQAHSISLY